MTVCLSFFTFNVLKKLQTKLCERFYRNINPKNIIICNILVITQHITHK